MNTTTPEEVREIIARLSAIEDLSLSLTPTRAPAITHPMTLTQFCGADDGAFERYLTMKDHVAVLDYGMTPQLRAAIADKRGFETYLEQSSY